MRAIDADEFEKVIEAWIRMHWGEAFTGDDVGSDFLEMLDEEPTLDVKPVVHAHWIPEYPNKRTGKAYWHKCSECGRSVFDNRQVSIDEMGYAFCPHCGAKMDEEKKQ